MRFINFAWFPRPVVSISPELLGCFNRRNTRIIITKLPEFTNLPKILGISGIEGIKKKNRTFVWRFGLRCMEWEAPVRNHLLITMKFQALSVGWDLFLCLLGLSSGSGPCSKVTTSQPMWVVLLGCCWARVGSP